jgi:integrase
MALMSYLTRDSLGTYYFRRVIPKELRPFMPAPWTGKANWKRSLRTKAPATAKQAAFRIGPDCMADFMAAERAMRGELALPSPRGLPVALRPEEIEADVLAGLLAADEAERADGDARRHHQTREEREQWPDLVAVPFGRKGMADDHHHVYGEEVEELHGEYRKALSRSDPGIVDAECRALLRQRGIPIDPTSDAYREAGLAVLRAHVRAYGLMGERQRGEIVTTPAPSAGPGPKLSEAFEAWKAGSGARGSRKPSDRTLLEAEYAVRRLTEWHGDIRLGDLSREKAREFRDALVLVPTRLTGNLGRLPLRELLKQDLKAFSPAHAATINKSLTMLAAITSHAEAAGKLDAVSGFRNPFGKGIKLVVSETAKESRLPFDTKDLAAIFGTAVYREGARPMGGGGEAAFWLPVLALLSGARQGELAQLRVMDLAQDDETGIWHLAIGTAGGRSIKTASSRRRVPIHPALVGIGLLRYRQGLVDAGAGHEAPLWPHVEADQEGRQGGPWSKWFNRHLRLKAGVTDRAKVFHSFRHTFKRLARDCKLPEEVHDALTGHAGGGVGRGYGKGFGLKALAQEIARIEAPEAVRGLVWEPSGADISTRRGGQRRARGERA